MSSKNFSGNDSDPRPKKARYELPTLDEQQQLQNAEGVLQHNFLNQQVHGVLDEIRAKFYDSKPLSDFISRLSSFIKTESSLLSGTSIGKEWLLSRNVSNLHLFDHQELESDLEIEFSGVDGLECIGSYNHQAITAPFCNVDMFFSIPSSCFNERDLLNYGYFNKKALYTSVVAYLLGKFSTTGYGMDSTSNVEEKKKTKKKDKSTSFLPLVDCKEVLVTYYKGDLKKPCILFRPIGHLNKRIRGLEFRIFPSISPIFRLNQLIPSKNNVRTSEWIQHLREQQLANGSSSFMDQSVLDQSLLVPTPNYNATIAEDMSFLIERRIVHDTLAPSNIAKDTLLLLKVWLAQRELRFGLDTFDSYCASHLIAYLVQTKRLTPMMPLFGAFHMVIKFLVDNLSDSSTARLNFQHVNIEKIDNASHCCRLELVHPIGTRDKFIEHDVFWRVSDSIFGSLYREAMLSLMLLNGCQSSSNSTSNVYFERLFLSKSSIIDREDIIFRLNLPIESSNNDSTLVCPIDVPQWAFVSNQLFQLTKDGLNDRIVSIATSIRPSHVIRRGNVTASNAADSCYFPPQNLVHNNSSVVQGRGETASLVFLVGVSLNGENASRKVDKGPKTLTSDSFESEAFRMFWGPRCELRRFQDGSIVDAVVWEGNHLFYNKSAVLEGVSVNNRGSLLIGEILAYLWTRHFPQVCGHEAEYLRSPSLALEWEPMISSSSSSTHVVAANKKNTSSLNVDHWNADRRIGQVLDKLQSLLIQRYEKLPLLIEEIMPVDNVLRHTSVDSIFPHPLLQELGKNKRSNIQGKKLPLSISPLLILGRLESSGKWPVDQEAVRHLKAAFFLKLHDILEKEHEVNSVLGENSLDILLDGFAFRLCLLTDYEYFHSRELLSKAMEAKELLDLHRLVSQHVDDKYHNCRLVRLTLHHQRIKAVVAEHPCFPDTVRMFNRWLNSHCFSGLLSVEVQELLVASVFLDFFPRNRPPTSALAAFFATLKRISSFEWTSFPFFIDFDNSFTSSEKASIQNQFDKSLQSSHYHPLMYFVPSYGRNQGFAPILGEYLLSRMEMNLIVRCCKMSYESLFEYLDYEDKSDMMDYCHLPSSTILSQQAHVILSFSKELFDLEKSMAGDFPAYSVIQTFKNAPSMNISYRDLIVRHCYEAKSFHLQQTVLTNLRREFGKFALFFWNANLGDHVYVIWKPAAFLPKNMSIMDISYKTALILEPSASLSSPSGSQMVVTIPNTLEILTKMLHSCQGYIERFDLI